MRLQIGMGGELERVAESSSVQAIPARMRAAPGGSGGQDARAGRGREVSQAKTGSRVRRSAVWVGGRCCWAQLWMVKAAAVASRLVTARAMTRRGVTVEVAVCRSSGRVMAMMSAATPIWRVASWPAGTRGEVWARARRCPAKAMAQARVRRSPSADAGEEVLQGRFRRAW